MSASSPPPAADPAAPPAFKDHFSTGSAEYAAHRPSYPAALVDALADRCSEHDLALDVACGTGQFSVLLATRFDAVLATDASASQIAHAEPAAGVRYRTALAEDSGLPEGTVDLVTVAQAAHWLDLDRFHAEVRRVARPGALVALISYGVLQLDGSAEAEAVLAHHYHEVLDPHWPPERRHVEDGYRRLSFPYEAVELPPLAMEQHWNAAELIAYVRTWSAQKSLAQAEGGLQAIADFDAALTAAWGHPQTRRRVAWPLTLRVGRVAA